jgi:polysaccharide export outer membrane protein
MPGRRRRWLLSRYWGGLALCLFAIGCQVQIAFLEPNNQTGSAQTMQQQARPPEASPLTLASANTPNSPAYNAMPPGPALHPLGPTDHGPGVGMASPDPTNTPPVAPVPTEKAMRSLPPYVVEPPDILLIDTIRMIPKPPYTVSPLDVLLIRVAEPLPNQPIEGTYTVGPDGTVNLGYSYGLVQVGGLTLREVEAAIRRQLSRVLKEPQVAVGVAQFRGVQLARGEHLVRPDGTINLGTYGCVYVAGLTLMQVKVAIERHLSQFVLDPEVTVDVFAYNSKEFFIITDGAGYGQRVYRLPVTGSDTVLRAISLIQGLPAVASKKKIWVARPAPADHNCFQILPVDWKAITQGGATNTNYQIFPGDRIYVHSDALICFNNELAKFLAPLEQLLGFALFTGETIQTFRTNGNGGIGFIAPIR